MSINAKLNQFLHFLNTKPVQEGVALLKGAEFAHLANFTTRLRGTYVYTWTWQSFTNYDHSSFDLCLKTDTHSGRQEAITTSRNLNQTVCLHGCVCGGLLRRGTRINAPLCVLHMHDMCYYYRLTHKCNQLML